MLLSAALLLKVEAYYDVPRSLLTARYAALTPFLFFSTFIFFSRAIMAVKILSRPKRRTRGQDEEAAQR